MEGFKGTPGPWKVNELGKHWNNNSLIHLEVTYGQDGECICDTVYERADANLIAAAPDLLEALQSLTEALNRGTSRDVGFAEKMASDAIKKALGQ